MAAYASLLPLTSPLPTLRTPGVFVAAHQTTEHDLARNPSQPAKWASHLAAVLDGLSALELEGRGTATEDDIAVLGTRLATEQGRTALQRLTDVYERAIAAQPGSYGTWHAYLSLRRVFVLGTPEHPHKPSAPKKKQARSMASFLGAATGEEVDEGELEDGERDWDMGPWKGALDPVIGLKEWESLAAAHERALMALPYMPRIWLSYLSLFLHPSCPASLKHTHARRTFDRALRTLPGSLHERIWRLYLLYATTSAAPEAAVRIWRRYLAVEPSPTSFYVRLLLKFEKPRALEAAKLALGLARRVQGGAKSEDGKSAYALLVEWLEVVEAHGEAVGISLEESTAAREAEQAAASSSDGVVAARTAPAEETDPTSTDRLDVEAIVRADGLAVFHDQAGRLWSGLATYWTRRGELDRAREVFHEALGIVVTLRDFTQVFDALAEFEEGYIASLMEALAEEEGEDAKEIEEELEERMKAFEKLMDERPFKVNEVLLRRNPNDVQEWEKRIALHGADDEKVAETYTEATKAIVPRKATGSLHLLYVHFAKFYETGGVSGEAEPDLAAARKIFEKATQVGFRKVDELAEVWCEWAEMEVRNEEYERAFEVMGRATAVPSGKRRQVSFHDESLPPQQRLFKSLKLWSFAIDLEESIGSVESTKAAYDRCFELKIANAQMVVNFANFLEENQYWEESFKVYERGVELFTYPVAFEIWNAYLSKFIKRYGGDKLERARDLFEQALEECPPKFTKPLFLLYGHMEEEYGLAKRAMAVYERATAAVETKDRFEMFTYYIAKVAATFGLPATRPIYQKAIEVLPDKQTAEMCLRFAALERKLGEIDRARAIFAHASQFCDPRSNPTFWDTWNSFEIETGSEDTFREYLRIKRAVQASFNTESSYLAAKAAAVRAGGVAAQEAVHGAPDVDPMSALDAATGAKPAFVPAKDRTKLGGTAELEPEQVANADEIDLEDDDDEEEEE